MSNGRRGAGAASPSSTGNARGASGEAPANVWARLMRKQLSPVEVARAALERIAAWENKIKSVDEVGALALVIIRGALARRRGAEPARRSANHHQGQHRESKGSRRRSALRQRT
jgi:hypothetical protein